jgi:hypothetical protein
VGGYPLEYTMLKPHGAEMTDKQVNALQSMHWIFDTAVDEYRKGRTFAESSE